MSTAARGTTPTFTLTFTEETLDLTQANNVYVTFQSGVKTLTKTGEDLVIAPKQISVFLSQEDTLYLGEVIFIQANWTKNGGIRAASDVVTYQFSPQLLKEVIE